MLKATIKDLALFENFLTVINKFVQRCQFILTTDGVNVYCKNQQAFPSSRLLLDTNIIVLDKDQKVGDEPISEVRICVRDIIALKSALSIVQTIEEQNTIQLFLDETYDSENQICIKSIKYLSLKGASFNLISINFDVIKDFISKDLSTVLTKDWEFNIDPKKLDISQNRTNNIINLDEVSVYLMLKEKTNQVMIKLGTKTKSSLINSILIPISDESKLNGIVIEEPIAIHSSSFKILNILKVDNEQDLSCFYNKDNNIIMVSSQIKSENGLFIKSRLMSQIIQGK